MMRICFILAGLASAATLEVAAAPPPPATSVVRVDPRSGRLIRTVPVRPRVVPSKVIQPRVVSSQAPGARAAVPAGDGIDAIVEAAAGEHQLDPLLVHSVIQVESNYNQYAISPKGAEGLMQLIPSTARQLGVNNSFDPKQNIEAGVRHLKYLKDKFGDDRLALAAYNAGEGAVTKYNWIPPYQETRNYVYQVGKRWGQLREAKKKQPAPGQPAEPPAAPEYRPVESFVDSEGRLHLRTR